MKKIICFVSFLFLGLLVFFSTVSASYTFTTPALRQGSTGSAIKQLQMFLNTSGYATSALTADGNFGPATVVAVKKWQSAVGLTADGVVGSQSMAILNGGVSVGTGNYPTGCSSNTGYSITTGQSCNVSSTVITNLPIGCTSTSVYSTTTGQLCSAISIQPGSQNNSGPISLSQAMQKYNTNFYNNFSCTVACVGPSVDITGTVSQVIAPTNSLSTASIGNTIIIQDGAYLAAVHNISDSDFQKISVGDLVEIQGQMQGDGKNNPEFYGTYKPVLVTVLQNVTAAVPISSSQTSASVNYSSFSKIQLSQYANDPSTYNGQKIQFAGMVLAFLPKGGSGGTTNYLSMEDLATSTKIMAEVDDSTMYSALVNNVQMPAAFLEVYGIGTTSQNFTNGLGATMSVSVLQLSAADACTGDDYSCTGTLQHLVP
jgi:peptidoglycan hydrolase-like protein with peptidoglycan-binding domain